MGAEETLASIRFGLDGTAIFPRERPTRVYHYTTIEGLEGILSSGKVWATDLGYTNDTTEYNYADRIIDKVAARLRPERRGDRDQPWDKILSVLRQGVGYKCFAFCFCEKGDLLSQWRGYTEFGTGYSLEFDWHALERRFASTPNVFMGRVEYKEKSQGNCVRKILSSPALANIISPSF